MCLHLTFINMEFQQLFSCTDIWYRQILLRLSVVCLLLLTWNNSVPSADFSPSLMIVSFSQLFYEDIELHHFSRQIPDNLLSLWKLPCYLYLLFPIYNQLFKRKNFPLNPQQLSAFFSAHLFKKAYLLDRSCLKSHGLFSEMPHSVHVCQLLIPSLHCKMPLILLDHVRDAHLSAPW